MKESCLHLAQNTVYYFSLSHVSRGPVKGGVQSIQGINFMQRLQVLKMNQYLLISIMNKAMQR